MYCFSRVCVKGFSNVTNVLIDTQTIMFVAFVWLHYRASYDSTTLKEQSKANCFETYHRNSLFENLHLLFLMYICAYFYAQRRNGTNVLGVLFVHIVQIYLFLVLETVLN